MTHANDPALNQMQALLARWQAQADRRAVFLDCYRRMTSNMFAALGTGEFQDPVWVESLLHHFAGYYFNALEAYERGHGEAPAVWQLAHTRAAQAGAPALQLLLLGVNAHINYDLVLTVDELLAPEWPALSEAGREARYQDFTRVNRIIGRTIDEVQDEILEPAEPILDLFDRLLGPVDEMLISHVISSWREIVWRRAVELLETSEPAGRTAIVLQVEEDALRTAGLIA
jgi:hypothetical protein